jgi:hypothetical protein
VIAWPVRPTVGPLTTRKITAIPANGWLRAAVTVAGSPGMWMAEQGVRDRVFGEVQVTVTGLEL